MRAKLLFLAMAGWLYGALALAGPPGPGHSHAGEIRRLQHQERERRDHIKQQKEENAAFRQSLKDMTPAERQAAITEHRQTQSEENLVFLKERLAANSTLTDAQKEELISFFEEQFQESVDFHSTQHQENVAFFESIANDTSLTFAQKKEAIREHFLAQRAENKAFREEQKSENQAERAAITSAVESAAETK